MIYSALGSWSRWMVDIHTGGLVSNTGLAMKLFGADVSLMTKIGKDAFGDILRRIYAGYGAAGDLIEDEGSSTSYSIVLAVPGIDRLFLHDPEQMIPLLFLTFPKRRSLIRHCSISAIRPDEENV
jgi:sugar/nucleoside kinase (ribokinase family)